jgi:hypothetical protein
MYLSDKDKHWLRVKGVVGLCVAGEEIFQANGRLKQAGVVILISNEVDFRPKLEKTMTVRFI